VRDNRGELDRQGAKLWQACRAVMNERRIVVFSVLAPLLFATCARRAPEAAPKAAVEVTPAPASALPAPPEAELPRETKDAGSRSCSEAYENKILACEEALVCKKGRCDQRLMLDAYRRCLAEAERAALICLDAGAADANPPS
jgi:hypothetical protein